MRSLQSEHDKKALLREIEKQEAKLKRDKKAILGSSVSSSEHIEGVPSVEGSPAKGAGAGGAVKRRRRTDDSDSETETVPETEEDLDVVLEKMLNLDG